MQDLKILGWLEHRKLQSAGEHCLTPCPLENLMEKYALV
jgi:hypothetical protein